MKTLGHEREVKKMACDSPDTKNGKRGNKKKNESYIYLYEERKKRLISLFGDFRCLIQH